MADPDESPAAESPAEESPAAESSAAEETPTPTPASVTYDPPKDKGEGSPKVNEVNGEIAKLPAGWPEAPEITGECAAVFEADSGMLIYAKDATKAWYPASTTKIMTGLLACETLNLSDEITYSKTAIYTVPAGASTIALNAGEVLTVEQSLYGLLLPSANEVANGIAEASAGSIEAFVSKMNERANKIGTVNTHFVNANGLHDPEHYSCAYDLGLIYLECVKNPTFLKVDSTLSYVIPPTNKQPEQRAIRSSDDMMNRYTEYFNGSVVAGKNGSTAQAGKCLVTYASKNGVNLVVVILGEPDNPTLYADTAELMNYGFENFYSANISVNDLTYNSVNSVSTASPITIPKQEISLFSLGTDDYAVLPKETTFDKLQSTVQYEEGKENDGEKEFATILYRYNGFLVGKGHLVVNDTILSKEEFSSKTNHAPEMEQVSLPEITPEPEENDNKFLGLDFSEKNRKWSIAILVLAFLILVVIGVAVFAIVNTMRQGGGGKTGKKGGRSGGKNGYRKGAEPRKNTHIV